mgnify:CR=1 FL=1
MPRSTGCAPSRQAFCPREGIRLLITQLAADQPETALRMLDLLPADAIREQALRELLQQWATKDPDAVKTWAAQRADPKERILGQLAYALGLAETDPAAAAASLRDLKLVEGRTREILRVFNEFAKADPQAAAAWLNDLPGGTSREKAVERFVAASPHEPKLAWEWALRLNDSEAQKKALRIASREWLKANDAQARQAIQSSGLPTPVIGELLKGN